jgi:DNA-binding GntR family transcriptional regulator
MPSSQLRKQRAGRRPAAAKTADRPGAVSSLRDAAYEAIKNRIITCAFRPGEYINELQLSAMLEGMVEDIPRKGVIVKPVSLNEVLQIIEVRLVNEPYGARLAADHANDTDFEDLADVLKRAKHWASLRNVNNMMLLDREFHLLIARAARNTVLMELLRTLHERSLRFWFISLTAPSQYESVQSEHAAIFEAIRKRNADRADEAMRRHIESFRTNVTKFL